MSAVFAQPKADGQGFVDLRHRTGIQRTHLFAQTALVDGANLLEQHDGISGKPAAFAIQLDVGGQLVLIGLAGDGSSDDRWTVPVADVILHDKYRSYTALLRADHRTQVA